MGYSAKKVLLTFDVEGPPHKEDFLDNETLKALYRVLELLREYDLKGVFFLTASAAKVVADHSEILELLRTHEIGYHSTSHSIKPAIFEYTDIEKYEDAVEISCQREASEIDPFTGAPEGKGGVLTLRRIFPEKEITAFRAPFFCWSPPHLEALSKLGFRFDFSSDISRTPVFFEGINFMPFPTVIDSILSNFHVLVKKVMSETFLVFLMHPSHMLFKTGELAYPEYNNPSSSVTIRNRSKLETKLKFLEFESFLSCLHLSQRKGLIELQRSLTESRESLDPKKVDVKTVYERSIFAAKMLFGYDPKFIQSHFHRFLERK